MARANGSAAGVGASDGAGNEPVAAAARLFAGPGEMRARCRALDWAATPLGPVEGWSPALRTAVRLCLDAGVTTCPYAGPALVLVYNDPYRASLGAAKHPGALGRPAREVWAEAWDQIAPEFAQVLAGGPAVFRENQRFVLARAGRPEEAYFTYAFAPVRDEAGRVVAVHNVSTETTAQVVAERQREAARAALAAERERLREVLLQAPTPMALLVGPEHRLDLVNDAYRRVSGGGRDVTGLTFREAFPELEGQPFFDIQDRVYATGEPWAAAAVLVRYDRLGAGVEDAYFDLRYEPVRDAEGRVFALLNYGVDVTEQVRARRQVEGLLAAERAARADAERARERATEERELATEARRAAEAANRAKSEFLTVMSHELRTPLNAIGGYAELVELGIHGPVTDAQRTALARIQQSQRHLLGLIAGVLDYARVEAGAVTYRLVDVPVGAAVAEAEVLVAPQLRAKGLGYAWSGAPPELRVRADREKLQQILLNLLGNALKFTQARDGAPGQIAVACSVEPGTEGDGGGAADGSPDARVRLHVRDTGEGIAPDALERIFEPFVQADQRLTRPHAGVGLGLAISRDLARGMGGDLTAESEVGVGSTLTLTLPAAR